MAIEKNVMEINSMMNDLQAIMDQIVRCLEVNLNALPHRQEDNLSNDQWRQDPRAASKNQETDHQWF